MEEKKDPCVIARLLFCFLAIAFANCKFTFSYGLFFCSEQLSGTPFALYCGSTTFLYSAWL